MVYSGAYGYLAVGGNIVLHMNSWSIDISNDTEDIISFGEKFREKIATSGEWSADCGGTADFSTPSGQKALFDAAKYKNLITVVFGLDSTRTSNADVENADKTYFKGNGFIDDYSVDNEADGTAELTVSFVGSGDLELHSPNVYPPLLLSPTDGSYVTVKKPLYSGTGDPNTTIYITASSTFSLTPFYAKTTVPSDNRNWAVTGSTDLPAPTTGSTIDLYAYEVYNGTPSKPMKISVNTTALV